MTNKKITDEQLEEVTGGSLFDDMFKFTKYIEYNIELNPKEAELNKDYLCFKNVND